ncbi:carbohydrate ABC transporter substrate-binding protein [Paenibacillus hemerocallicola]|uniref:Carbohydrate ABC transporter substrate-binding protein n=2 Tax=Paenibacillus hemerocallicola TaxID=1172614 RepID=A0A5C4T1L7_9BACL|nr:carbohydrate ABC transporter substrate-binding protein [Paenibacillus hemerocallicola]
MSVMLSRKKLLMIAICFAVTACGDKQNTDSAPNDAGKSTDTAADPKKITDTPTDLYIAYPGSGEKDELFMQRFGEQIKKKFPNYTLKYVPRILAEGTNYYASYLASGAPIDIMISSLGTTTIYLTNLKLESDISDLIKKYNYDLARIEPSLIDIQRQLANGGIYGLPWTSGSFVFLYNKDIFDKFGVAYPKDGMTWDETYELAKKLTRTDGGTSYKGFAFQFENAMGTNQLSAPYFDSKTHKSKFLEDNFIKAFENMARFYKIPGNEPPTVGVPVAFQKDKTVAMFMGTSGQIKPTAEQVPNWNTASTPEMPQKPGVGFQAAPEYFYITSMSKSRDAAFQVLAYIASDEFQEWMGRTTAILPVSKNPDKLMQTFGADLPGFQGKNVKSLIPRTYAPLTITPYLTTGNSEMTTALKDYLGGKDLNTALREAGERADKRIATEQGK